MALCWKCGSRHLKLAPFRFFTGKVLGLRGLGEYTFAVLFERASGNWERRGEWVFTVFSTAAIPA